MADAFKLFSNDAKIQQFVAQFACRVPTRNELTAGEKKALENSLRELDPEIFQLFSNQSIKNPSALFEVLRQHTIDANVLTMPSFVFSNDSFSFIYPIKMLGKFVLGVDSINTKPLNKTASSWGVKVQNAVSNCRCQRAGKIYEFVLGPFTITDKKKLFDKLFSLSLDDVGHVNALFAKYIERDGKVYNIQTTINYTQGNLNDGFFVNMRIDINNRKLLHSMEPPDIERVWDFADSVITDHLSSNLAVE